MAEITMGNLHDMNKQLSEQMPVKTAPEIMAFYPKISDWFEHDIDKYAMLLCHEQKDFTLFNKVSDLNTMAGEATKALFECIENRGELVSLDPADGDAWEIWIRINNGIGGEDKFEDYCYYLFNYDAAVIEV